MTGTDFPGCKDSYCSSLIPSLALLLWEGVRGTRGEEGTWGERGGVKGARVDVFNVPCVGEKYGDRDLGNDMGVWGVWGDGTGALGDWTGVDGCITVCGLTST